MDWGEPGGNTTLIYLISALRTPTSGEDPRGEAQRKTHCRTTRRRHYTRPRLLLSGGSTSQTAWLGH